jgi:hypothetical protein
MSEFASTVAQSGVRASCSTAGCSARIHCKGVCESHYRQARYVPKRRVIVSSGPPRPTRTCLVEGCGKPMLARDLCNMHYARAVRTGDFSLTGAVCLERMCATCGTRPCGRYLHCRHCRTIAENQGFKCPLCGGPKSKSSKLCRLCRHMVRGPDHGAWKGGVVRSESGYVVEYAPDHPRANMGRYVKQHHLVMERALERYLLPGESVHHRNGVRDDNRLENLELWFVGQPAGQRVVDLIDWARALLDQYKDVPAEVLNRNSKPVRADVIPEMRAAA